MKRKSGRKQKGEETSSESAEERNGDTSDQEEEAPKKRRSTKRNVSPKKSDASSVDSEHADDQDAKEDKSTNSHKSSKKDSLEEDPLADEVENGTETKKAKRGRKPAQKDTDTSNADDEDDDSHYEVEEILDEKMVKGVRHYLIRWKGYEEESDTWEPENTLDCPDVVAAFKEKKNKEKKKEKPKKTTHKKKGEEKEADWDENEEFEVDRILDVHFCRNGKREFLVSWKGYKASESTWEPEENMDCKELIEKFMAKVEKARDVDERELRVKREPVHRFTLNAQQKGRRLSRRLNQKERVQYLDAE